MQTLPELAAQLEAFRTSALSIHFSSEKKEAAEVNTYMDSLIGLDNVQVPEVPIVNSRAGLYIYLSAAVSYLRLCRDLPSLLTGYQLVGRPMIDDATLFTYLNNRYQVRACQTRSRTGTLTNKQAGRHTINRSPVYPGIL